MEVSQIAPYLEHPLVLVGFVLFAIFGLYRVLVNSGVIRPLSSDVSGTVVHRLLDHGFLLAMLVVLFGFSVQLDHGVWLAPFIIVPAFIVLAFYVVYPRPPGMVPSAAPTTERGQRNRKRMLEKVHYMWIKGVLEESLYHVARIEVGLVGQPWKLVAQQPERVPQSLPDGTPMHVVFDQFDKTLLLLGAPGSGKTTLLLELTRDLMERAKEDPEHPIPVIFNLSSWAVHRSSLEAWLVDELSERYDVPRKLGEHWIDHDQVLPLLDGLDEVAREHRDACVEAINAFRQKHGLLPLVVCSRSAEYETLTVRLRLHGAVTIQPLTQAQVDGYLQRAGPALSGVRVALREDEALWELFDTPLMLSVFALAYQYQIASGVRITRLKGSLQTRRAALFDAYIDAMFKWRDTASPYTSKQMRHWLSWLAQAMAHHDQTIFYLEHMQPDWLTKVQARLQRISSGVFAGLSVGLLIGLFVGLLIDLLNGLLGGFFLGLFFGLLFGRRRQIQLVEALHWSWKGLIVRLSKDLLFMLRIALLFALLFGLLTGLYVGFFLGLLSGLLSGLLNGLLSVLLSVLFIGLSFGLIEDEIRVRAMPNEGIHRSLRNALGSGLLLSLFVGLLLGLLSGVLCWRLLSCLYFGLLDSLIFWLFVGLLGGLFVGLEKGGNACIQHGVLRLLVWRYDYAPLRYVRFLDSAVERLFLRRVGGGYIFVHRMLMEHFAGLEER